MNNSQVLTVGPGDTVVVTIDRILTQAQRETVTAHIKEQLNIDRVAVLDGGLTLTVLRAVA